MNLLNAPSATPSRAAKARTSAGLMTRLNELTIDRAKAPSEPIAMAPYSEDALDCVMSPVMSQVTAAAASTTNRVRAVRWTTESMVIASPASVCVGE